MTGVQTCALPIYNQMIVEGYAWNYDGGTKVKNFAELDAKRKKWFTLILLEYF